MRNATVSCFWVWAGSLNNNLTIVYSLGLDKIEFLQSHQNTEIYEKTFNIIRTYFSNDEEDVAVAPSTENNQFQFNADQSVPMDGFQF